jgi:hypothetical protein
VREPLALTLVVVYGFAAFHKLNASFFDPAVSCAGALIDQGLRLQGWRGAPPGPDVIRAAAVLTVIWELTIAALLAVPRWRVWGVLTGFVLHVGLAFAHFYDFSTYVLAIFVLLLPGDGSDRLANSERYRRLAIAGWLSYAMVTALSRLTVAPVTPIGMRWHTLQVLAWCFAVGSLIIPALRASLGAAERIRGAPRRRPAWLLAIPVLAAVNGATPYLGFKTVANFSMFSNLRTETGATNHLLVGLNRLPITNWLDDTVEVKTVGMPAYGQLGLFARARGGRAWFDNQLRWRREGPVILPWLELRRAALLWKDAGMGGVRVTYVYRGEPRTVDDAASDVELSAPLPWWIRWFCAFRAIQPEGQPVRCRW